jgi:hypothetical protein
MILPDPHRNIATRPLPLFFTGYMRVILSGNDLMVTNVFTATA